MIGVINFPNFSEKLFYDLHCDRDEWPRPFICLREAIEQKGARFQHIDYDCIADVGYEVPEPFYNFDPKQLRAVISLRAIRHPIFKHVPRERRILCVTEPNTSFCSYLYDPALKKEFGTIFTLLDDLVDNETFFKLHHMQMREKRVENILDFEQKKLCIMVQNNPPPFVHINELYSERRRIAAAFPPEEFDLFGNGWTGFPSWKGYLGKDKLEFLRKYKFCFCYENTKEQAGYITERLFECLFGGCIPIYWGAPNITDVVPKNCFIDRRDFKSNQELYRFMKAMDKNTYKKYLESGKNYLQSKTMKENYSPNSFSNTICKRLFEICGDHE